MRARMVHPVVFVFQVSLCGATLLGALLAPEASAQTGGDDGIKTLVMELSARREVDPQLAATMTDVAINALSGHEGRTAYGPRDLAAVLDVEASKAALGCTDSSCLSEIASAMNVDTIITGSIDTLGDSYVVLLSELNADTARPIARAQKTSPKTDEGLLEALNLAVDELVEKSAGKVRAFGRLELETRPSGLYVDVDGKEIGPSPINLELPVGAHQITVENDRDPHAPAVFDVSIRRKMVSRAEADIAFQPDIDPVKVEAYESAVLWHNIWLFTKLGVGGCITCIGACSLAYTAVVWASFLGAQFSNAGEQLAAYGFAGIVSVIVLVFLAAGVAALGWGVFDFFFEPEEPGTPDPVHRIKVTPGGGTPREYDLPATGAPSGPKTSMAY